MDWQKSYHQLYDDHGVFRPGRLHRSPYLYEEVYQKMESTDERKRDLGFELFHRYPHRLWARAALKSGLVETDWGTKLNVTQPCFVIYSSNKTVDPASIDDLQHSWVRPDIFARSYAIDAPVSSDETYQYPDVGRNEEMLIQQGCFAVVKTAPAWAKQVEVKTAIITLESTGDAPPFEDVKPGMILCLGIDGEPYAMTVAKFKELYMNSPW